MYHACLQGEPDEFSRELTRELLKDVKDLRAMFNIYLEQLSGLSGPDVEPVMCSALEAVDMLDNALTLSRVSCIMLLQ